MTSDADQDDTTSHDNANTRTTEASTSALSALTYLHDSLDEKQGGDTTPHNNTYEASIHTQTTNDAFVSISAPSLYSSVHSDLKEEGSDEYVAFSSSSSFRNAPSAASTDTPTAVCSLTPHNDAVDLGPNFNDDLNENIKRRPSTRSNTLGGDEESSPIAESDHNHDTSTLLSSVVGDDSQSDYYDYSEEPSEYVPPTPKVGGFGVEPAKVEAQKGGIRSVASERVNKEVVAPSSPGHNDSWGANFWCIIEQPNDRSFFANPETGECAWAVPSGTFVLPPRPGGQWWELFDETRRLPYYYHTKTWERQWERPKGFIIPLAAIQESTLGKRFSRIELKGESMARVGEEQRKGLNSSVKRRSQPLPPWKEPQSLYQDYQGTARGSYRQRRHFARPAGPFDEHDLWNVRRHSRSRVATGLSTIPSSTDLQAASRSSSSKTIRKKPLSHRPHTSNGDEAAFSRISTRIRRQSFDLNSLSSVELQRPYRRERDPVKRRLRHHTRKEASTMPRIVRPLQLDVGRRRSLSLDESHKSNHATVRPSPSFSYEAFATQRYAVHRTGLFRRKCPVVRLMKWQKEPLRSSLLPLPTNDLRKDAVRFFQVILRYCGDRSNPVFWPEVPSSGDNTSPCNRKESCLKEKKGTTGPTVTEEVKWMLNRATLSIELKDEMYAQIMKQIIGNEKKDSLRRAWSLLCISLSVLTPSKDYITPLHRFIQQNGYGQNPDDIQVVASCCLGKLHQNDRSPLESISIADIEAAEIAPLPLQVPPQDLEDVVVQDNPIEPEAAVPKVLIFLTQEMLKRDCFSIVDVFRKAGDAKSVQDLQQRIVRGSFTLEGLFLCCGVDREAEVHILATTFKTWLHELQEPLFPESLLSECLKASQDLSEVIEICKKLDMARRRILIYVVTFLRLFCSPSVVVKTHMDSEAMSQIFAPVLLRSPHQVSIQIGDNVFSEGCFVKILIDKLPCHLLDGDFVPSFVAPTRPNVTAPTKLIHTQYHLGIGGNGAGLAPRSRKTSACRSS